ncbi:hypothetical protein pb186bvf_019423 [Paramecium bursaria]
MKLLIIKAKKNLPISLISIQLFNQAILNITLQEELGSLQQFQNFHFLKFYSFLFLYLMHSKSFLKVNNEHDIIRKRVKSLHSQLKNQVTRNASLQSKIFEVNEIKKFSYGLTSPLQELQESLRLDEKKIFDRYEPIKKQQSKYQHDQKIITEMMINKSKIQEQRDKQQRVRCISEYEYQIPYRVQEFNHQRQSIAKELEQQFVKQTQEKAKQKLRDMIQMQKQESELYTQIIDAKRQEIKLKIKFHDAFQKSPQKQLPIITNTRTQTPNYKILVSPFQSKGQVFDRLKPCFLSSNSTMGRRQSKSQDLFPSRQTRLTSHQSFVEKPTPISEVCTISSYNP